MDFFLPKKIYSIQMLRGIAALSVCWVHFLSIKISVSPIFSTLYTYTSPFARYGVDLFFIISGFIITLIVFEEHQAPSIKKGLGFLIKRIFRIYPLFWITMIFVVILFENNGVHTDGLKKIEDLSHFFLLTTDMPLQNAAWTLPFEQYFYGVMFFFLCFFPKKCLMPFFSIWALIHLVILYCYLEKIIKHVPFFLGSSQIFNFFFGLCIANFILKIKKHALLDKYIALTSGILLGCAGFILTYEKLYGLHFNEWSNLIFNGLSPALIVYGCVGLEICNHIRVASFLRKLGDMSYSIYLWHCPILYIFITCYTYQIFLNATHPFLQLLIQMMMIVIVSYYSYQWIERPFVRLSRKIVKRWF